jgi:2-oxoglutarate dehydrogenase E2 component (dihydrolipoamide succinyltransferase)
MALTLKVPSIGESIREATVGVWKKAEGDWVEVDEPLVEIESEKATLEVPAPGAGILKRILRQQGDTVAIGEALAEIDDAARPATVQGDGKNDSKNDSKTDGKAQTKASAKSESAAVSGSAAKSSNGGAAAKPVSDGASGSAAASAGASPGAQTDAAASATVLRAAPSARRMMADTGLTSEEVKGTGRGGRIQPLDVSRALDARKGNDDGGTQAPAIFPPATSPPVISPDGASGDAVRERIVPMSPLRRTIARRLVEAQHTAAILTTFNEIDMSAVLAMRDRYQERFTKQHGVKLGFMGFFVKATIEALKAFPAVNAEVRGTDIVYKDHYDIGVAVGGGKGLVVPIVRAADRLSFAELEKTIAALAAKAKDNKLQISELEGGTFTLSNGGVYGSMMSTPILNPPQSGILGLHAIQKRAIVVGDQIVVRPMMYVALSYDHRIVDGREAVQFLVRVKDCVETPERILLEI